MSPAQSAIYNAVRCRSAWEVHVGNRCHVSRWAHKTQARVTKVGHPRQRGEGEEGAAGSVSMVAARWEAASEGMSSLGTSARPPSPLRPPLHAPDRRRLFGRRSVRPAAVASSAAAPCARPPSLRAATVASSAAAPRARPPPLRLPNRRRSAPAASSPADTASSVSELVAGGGGEGGGGGEAPDPRPPRAHRPRGGLGSDDDHVNPPGAVK
uniref:Uncharacterized protein n=1 Tax=Oryza meridionalis TaxID=40149 RepID=A0A0E0E5Y9_9ORYZ